MMIDCDACVVRGPACGDCVVTVLLGAAPAHAPADGEPGIDLDGEEQAAIAVLAGSGLVPPLRLVAAPVVGPPVDGRANEEACDCSKQVPGGAFCACEVRPSAPSSENKRFDVNPCGARRTAV